MGAQGKDNATSVTSLRISKGTRGNMNQDLHFILTRCLLDESGLVLPVDEDEVDRHSGQDDGDSDAWKDG